MADKTTTAIFTAVAADALRPRKSEDPLCALFTAILSTVA